MPDRMPEERRLPEIPVLSLEWADWPVRALKADIGRCHTILDDAHSFMPQVPQFAISAADKISRRWLVKTNVPWLAEVDEISRLLDRPGVYALNVAYEWGCTARVTRSVDGKGVELVRILDWPFVGLGRNIVAMRIASETGEWLNLSWPGFTGVLQGVAKGRFAAVLNQAPLEKSLNISPYLGIPLDWMSSRVRVWRSGAPAPVHLLRQVFETARDYDEAKDRLCHHALAIPAIFTLSGVKAGQGCVIERQRDKFRCFETPASAANHWQNAGQAEQWNGYPRASMNPERACQLSGLDLSGYFPSAEAASRPDPFGWLEYPVLNQYSRLAIMADARTGYVTVQGIEDHEVATQPLQLSL